jgi:hypothetical protein
MRLEAVLGRFHLRRHPEARKVKTFEIARPKTLDEFVAIAGTSCLNSVDGFVERELIPHTGVGDTLLGDATGFYDYNGVLTGRNDNKLVIYRENYGAVYGSSPRTGFINRTERERMSSQALATIQDRLNTVSSRIPGTRTHLIDLSTGRPFTSEQLERLEQDKKRLRVRPLSTSRQ